MKIKLLLIAILTKATMAIATETPKVTVSGYVTDEHGESLIGASVYDQESMTGVLTNTYGFYSLSLPAGKYNIACSYVGYELSTIHLVLNEAQKLNIRLQPKSTNIEEVEITAENKNANITNVKMSTEKLAMKTIKKLPVFMGESDVIKSIQLLPGVTAAGEGSSGFNVRGGSVDQNLILLDDATVYNPSHIGGFFSVFNGDALKGVELYKGGISAYYGGRLSSVLDVHMREGSMNSFKADLGIGVPIASRATIEGPIVKERMSFIISGRRSYIDQLVFPFSKNEGVKNSMANFYDLNAKINAIINNKNRVFLSFYSGNDLMDFDQLLKMTYGNTTGTIRYNSVLNAKLFMNVTAIYSNFNYYMGIKQSAFAFNWYANVIDWSLKNDYTYYLGINNTIRAGVQATYHIIRPGYGDSPDGSNFRMQDLVNNYALELNAYIENEQKINNWLTARYGIRYTTFNNMGGQVYEIDENFIAQNPHEFKKDSIHNTFSSLAPRLSLRAQSGINSSFKASYNRTNQYLHMATNTAATTPLDIWFMSNPNIRPQYADQVAVGYFQNINNNTWQLSAEAYYKKMYHSIDFKDHAELFFNEEFDAELRFGNGYSQGLELMAKKQEGKLTGWCSYTLSKTRKKIQHVNDNKEYPSAYDKPHDLKIVANYQLKKRMSLTLNWVFASPLPITIVESWYEIENTWVPRYSGRNKVRLKGTEYHRLDVALNLDLKNKTGKNYKHGLNLSVINAYNRHNLYSIVYEKEEGVEGPPQMQKLYLFGIIPSLTYNIKF